MVDLIEKLIKVYIHYPSVALLDMPSRRYDGLMCTLSGSESVAVFRKVGVEDFG